jgi:hypothetical protein
VVRVYHTARAVRREAPISPSDHYLSRGLGTFKNNDPSSMAFSKTASVCLELEDVFAHNNPEA